jgi:hypothetical protein
LKKKETWPLPQDAKNMMGKKLGPGTMSGAQEKRPGDLAETHRSRRSGRIRRQVSVLLFGYDEEGHAFTEHTHTVVLSQHGAGIISRHKFAPEQELILRVEETNREAEVRVVGEIAAEGDLHTYGVALLDDRLDFWQMEFPAAPISDDRPPVLTLECGSCGEMVDLLNGEFEYDICQIHGGLTRHCAECGALTVWRRAEEKAPRFGEATLGQGRPFEKAAPLSGVRGEQEKPFEAQGEPESQISGEERRLAEPASSSRAGGPADAFLRQGKQEMGGAKAGWRDEVREEGKIGDTESGVPKVAKRFAGLGQGDRTAARDRNFEIEKEEEPLEAPGSEPAREREPNKERRNRVRAKVNFFACVKTERYGKDVVTCIDMSRGGVGFRGKNEYKKDMKIEIAVPYSAEAKDAPAIFVKGRIAHVSPMDGMWRCGVEFLR